MTNDQIIRRVALTLCEAAVTRTFPTATPTQVAHHFNRSPDAWLDAARRAVETYKAAIVEDDAHR